MNDNKDENSENKLPQKISRNPNKKRSIRRLKKILISDSKEFFFMQL